MDFSQDLETLTRNLGEIVNTKTVIGDPVTVGEVTIVPVVTAAVAFGAGSGGAGVNGGGGAGGGLGLKPEAIVIIKGEEVNVFPIRNRTAIDKIADLLPDILSMIRDDKDR